MKKILVFITLLLLSSCSVDWKDENNEKIKELDLKIMKLNNINEKLVNTNNDLKEEIEKDIFDNNIKCLSLKDDINKRLVKNSNTFKETIKVEKIFYSQKHSSCLYIEYSEMDNATRNIIRKNWDNESKIFKAYNRRLFDVLNESKPILECIYSDINECKKIDNYIKSL